MDRTRRQFLQTAALAGTFAGVGGLRPAWARMQTPAETGRKLNLLILGGTNFLGPHIVEAALSRGHSMVLFNRGRSNPHLFPDLEKLRGDRDPEEGEGLKALAGRNWDAVIDTSGYVPRHVRSSAELLAAQAQHYVFISTISVYPEIIGEVDEDSPVADIGNQSLEEVTDTSYGALKVLCEQAVETAMPGRSVTIRPHLVAGPGDTTDRFNYWPARIARGGEILAPGSPEAPLQFVDVRDLSAFILLSVEKSITGLYNAAGPGADLTMGALLSEGRRALRSDCTFTWVPDRFLLSQRVGPWTEMPLWIPRNPEQYGRVSTKKIRKAGMVWSPVSKTVTDTEKWLRARPADYRWRAGLKAEKEAAVLAAWQIKAGKATAG